MLGIIPLQKEEETVHLVVFCKVHYPLKQIQMVQPADLKSIGENSMYASKLCEGLTTNKVISGGPLELSEI